MGWVHERFPLPNALLFLIMYLTAALYGQYLTRVSQLVISPVNIFGFLASWSFFLMLRIFDEHKDYAIDNLNHPQRILQRGLITLKHLQIAGAIAIALQLIVSISIDQGIGPVTRSWVIVMAYSILMAKEFYCGEWLQKRLVLYAFSHMLIMPLALLWMAQMGAGHSQLPSNIVLLCLLAFLSGAAFELTRKTKGPSEEQEGVDSYTKIYGTTGSPRIIMVILLLSLAVQITIISSIFGTNGGLVLYIVLTTATILPIYTLHAFSKSPSVKGRKINEATVALSLLVAYAALLCAAIMERGITWHW